MYAIEVGETEEKLGQENFENIKTKMFQILQ